MSVADLGTGVGYFLPALARALGPEGRMWAVDPDGENLEIARRRRGVPSSVRFLATSAAHVPEIPDASVDRVLLSLVICCLLDKEGAMDETWSILRPGGRTLVTYPRGFGLGRPERRSLRVTPDRWTRLISGHSWVVRPVRSSLAVHRHFLERPGAAASPTQA